MAEIQRLSTNGIAPRSHDHHTLRMAAAKHFGSWAAACEAAGVAVAPRPRKTCARGQQHPAATKLAYVLWLVRETEIKEITPGMCLRIIRCKKVDGCMPGE